MAQFSGKLIADTAGSYRVFSTLCFIRHTLGIPHTRTVGSEGWKEKPS
jgi:hypothetical protein